jgi:hypothetical protein
MVKKSIWLLTIFCILFAITACDNQQVRLKPVIRYEKDAGLNVIIDEDTGEEIVHEQEEEYVVLENNFLQLRFLPKTAEIILTDKSSGSVWYSTPLELAQERAADVVTTQLMKSQFSLQYANVSGVGETLYSNTQSIEQGLFEYELIGDCLEVRYTVGNISRSYIIPPALPVERMEPYLNNMDPDDSGIVKDRYRLYDIENLYPNDNRASLISVYPELANEKLYILRDNTQDYMKEQMEEYFAYAGYTREDYYEDIERYTVSSGSEKPAFNVFLRYSLEGKSLVVNVPFDKIAYRASYPITRLDLLPFFGAGNKEDTGYILVPDGSGAVINFNNGKQNQVAFNIDVFGWDEAMPREALVNDSKASFPVFGIYKNGVTMLCVIEEGSAYASVRADVSGRNCSYNSVYPCFSMIHGAIMDISGRSDRAVYLYEKGLPADENITLRYTPCAENGYVGMAKEYRSWLLNKYPFLGARKENSVPIAVEIVGAVNKTQHRLGIPFDLPLKLTSYNEMKNIVNNFADMGWKNVRVKLNGWFNRSVDHSEPSKIKLIGDLGSRDDFLGLVSAAKQNNFTLYPEADFLYIRDVNLFSSYSLYRDSARYVSRKRIEKYPYSFVWFGERIRWGKLSHVIRPVPMMNMIDKFVNKSKDYNLQNIAFRSIGAKLSGDYNEKRHVSREAAMKMRQDKLAELDKAGTNIIISGGFVYSVPWAGLITDMAIDDQSFGITDAAVPFYQIALHGLVPYTGRAINLAEDYSKNLLKSVECGAGLFFSFMTEEASLLQETKFRQFYANEYYKWIGDADALYRKFSSDFGHLYNLAIVDHQILSPGVTETRYEDGTRVIVNINSSAFDYNGVIVKTNDYTVLRRGE